ncbi:hypothetical protein P5V15_012177 [Pogonomyrmex californicus]
MISICAICRGVLISIDDVFFTPCGHLFHFQCLSQWLQSSETCPQCRRVTTSDKIHKAHFSLTETDDLTVDNSENISLQERIDDLKLQVLEKERDIEDYIFKNSSLDIDNCFIERQIKEIKSKISQKNSIIYKLRNQIIEIKLECDTLEERMNILKAGSEVHKKILWQEKEIKQLEERCCYLAKENYKNISIEKRLKTYKIENSSLRHRITELETTLLHVAPSNN